MVFLGQRLQYSANADYILLHSGGMLALAFSMCVKTTTFLKGRKVKGEQEPCELVYIERYSMYIMLYSAISNNHLYTDESLAEFTLVCASSVEPSRHTAFLSEMYKNVVFHLCYFPCKPSSPNFYLSFIYSFISVFLVFSIVLDYFA